MIKITCSSCQKPLSLDESKLPMKEVSFPCPGCKTKIIVDRRTLEAEAAAAAGAEHAAGRDDHRDAHREDHGEEFGEKALIVGSDSPALRHAAKLIGFLPVHIPTAEKAREFYNQEPPQVIMINAAQVTPPPLEAMQPIIALPPADRRKSFLILFSDNLRTFDGNAAFLYGVNLVFAPKDMTVFPQVYRDAKAEHERFYSVLFAVQAQMHQ